MTIAEKVEMKKIVTKQKCSGKWSNIWHLVNHVSFIKGTYLAENGINLI